jgi:hypothetical protein
VNGVVEGTRIDAVRRGLAGLPLSLLLAAFIAAAGVSPAPAATIVVDSTDDPLAAVTDGNCTLREAIDSVGSTGTDDCEDGVDAAADAIVFDGLSGPGPHVISASNGFILNRPASIDASNAPGEVRIDGQAAVGPAAAFGIQLRADAAVVRGLTVTRWSQIGVKIDIQTVGLPPADGVEVLDSFIGTDRSGAVGLGNGSSGVAVGIDNGDPDYQPDNTVIRGNVISGNANGVSVAGEETDNTSLAGNLIGTTPTATAALPNASFGVRVSGGADLTRIGGPATGDGNVISGNGSNAVLVSAAADDISGTIVRNNLIGLGADGSTALGNGGVGVALNGSVDNTELRGNAISANGSAGIQMADGASGGVDSTTIAGNRIGTDDAGSVLRANSEAVVMTAPNGQGITNTTVGGPRSPGGNCVDPCNVVAGGRILLNSPTVINTDILGNHIGLDTAGTSALKDPVQVNRIELNFGDDTSVGSPAGPNLIGGGNNAIKVDFGYAGEASIRSNRIGVGNGSGADLGASNAGVLIQGADGVVVGGTAAGEGNEIANNGTGVQVDTGGTNNPILGNLIYDNGGLGIDLFDGGGGGVTPNDVGDLDTGSNDLQNYPEIEVVAGGPLTRILGRFMSTAAALFRLEFFASPQPDVSGFGEGQRFIGSALVNGSGARSGFDVSVPAATAPGEFITATATRINGGTPGSTSEFSAAIEVDSCGVNAQAAGAIVGTPQPDLLSGTPSDDVICGGGGNDSIAPGEGNDVLIGGPGTDIVDHSTAALPLTVNLGQGASTGQGNNFLRSIEGVDGSGLADSLAGSAGADLINGGGGADVIAAFAGADRVDGGGGNDRVNAGTGNDRILGRGGNDRVFGRSGRDNLSGGGGDDVLDSGGGAGEVIRGGSGRDVLRGGAGRSLLFGDGGNDRLFGQAGRDSLVGGGGNDLLDSGSGTGDVARGGAGRDFLRGGAGRRDLCDGGSGRDRANRTCERKRRVP